MNKFFCISMLVCLSSMAVAGDSGVWNTKSSSGWATESSLRSRWKDESVNVKNSEAWKKPLLRDDAKGQGWVSSEVAEDFQPQSIPTSWQKVQKYNTDWVKSSGWEQKKLNNAWDRSALNPASQRIAKGLIVKHPVPSMQLSNRNESLLRGEKWDKESSVEDWQKDSLIKSSVESDWDKDAALKQWEQNQAVASSSWEKSAEVSDWQSDALAAAWQKEFEKESAAADAAAKEAANIAWQTKQAFSSGWEQQSASNGWQKESILADWEKSAAPHIWQKEDSSEETWQKSSTPAWNDVPAGWEKEAVEWQKDVTTSKWNLDSDFKAWQKETAANGWDKETAVKAWKNEGASNGWNNNTAMSVWYETAKRSSNAWEQDAPSTGWDKDAAPAISGRNNNKNLLQSTSKIYNDEKARGPAPSKWNK